MVVNWEGCILSIEKWSGITYLKWIGRQMVWHVELWRETERKLNRQSGTKAINVSHIYGYLSEMRFVAHRLCALDDGMKMDWHFLIELFAISGLSSWLPCFVHSFIQRACSLIFLNNQYRMNYFLDAIFRSLG